MGHTVYHIPANRDPIEAMVENHLSQGKVLAQHVHTHPGGQTLYAAVENALGQVEGWVMPFAPAEGGQMCVTGPFPESMLPYYFYCSAEILDLLSPTSDPNSLHWRKMCRLP